jgi:hypothetical protein
MIRPAGETLQAQRVGSVQGRKQVQLQQLVSQCSLTLCGGMDNKLAREE